MRFQATKNGGHAGPPLPLIVGAAPCRSILSCTVDSAFVLALCSHKFPNLICRPVAALFMSAGVICLFEFGIDKEGVGVASERHYRLFAPEEVDDEDLKNYLYRGGD